MKEEYSNRINKIGATLTTFGFGIIGSDYTNKAVETMGPNIDLIIGDTPVEVKLGALVSSVALYTYSLTSLYIFLNGIDGMFDTNIFEFQPRKSEYPKLY